MTKKILKRIGITLGSILFLALVAFGVTYYYFIGRFYENTQKYPEAVGTIAPSEALYNEMYELCDAEAIANLHHPSHLQVYEGSKKRFRNSVLSQFNENTFTDFGYVTFRFIVNCKGEPGWFEILQTDHSYNTAILNQALVAKLLDITRNPEHWSQRKNKNNEGFDYYMYVTYRLENGKVTEILP